MNIQDFSDLIKNRKFPEAFSILKNEGLSLSSDVRFFMVENAHLSDTAKDSLSLLIRKILFEDDNTPENTLLSYIKNRHFTDNKVVNFVIKCNSELSACSQVYSLHGEAIYLFSTVIGHSGSGINLRGKGLYRLFMVIKYLYALFSAHKFVVGRTQNPFSLEQYDKHGMFFNPNLYYKLHGSNDDLLSKEYTEELIGRSQIICKKSLGLCVDDDLMVSAVQVDGAKYVIKKQSSSNAIINDFFSENIIDARRFIAIREVNEKMMKHIYESLMILREKFPG